MRLTNKQEEGLKIALERYKNGEKYTVISGYAGSGKSTLVKHIVSAMELDEWDVVYTAFTGKATQVLQSKGNKNVKTLHKLLWEWRPQKNGGFFKIPKAIGESVVIVDEVSMASKFLIDELFNRPNIYIICLGDPGQLPPISVKDDNHLLDHPHVFLDEIMRQAAESEIIRLSMDIREGKPLSLFKGREVMILDKSNLDMSMLQWADQVLCAKNDTRARLNREMREYLKYPEHPIDGDKVICLKNYWENVSDCDSPLVNGTIGTIHNVYGTYVQYPPCYDNLRVSVMGADFCSDFGENYKTDIDTNYLMTEKPTFTQDLRYRISRNKNYSGTIPLEFAYGYAITCHKSQGSEWDKVLVVEENFPFKPDEHKRWLYTACTRAAKRLVIIRKD